MLHAALPSPPSIPTRPRFDDLPYPTPQIFYYVIMSVFGSIKGILQLNLGNVTSFQARVAPRFAPSPSRCCARPTARPLAHNTRAPSPLSLSSAGVGCLLPQGPARLVGQVHLGARARQPHEASAWAGGCMARAH